MFNRLLYRLLLAAPVFISACQSSPSRDFDKVSQGMTKGDVLEIMGSPSWTLRWKGMDRWNYSFYQDESLIQKELHFNAGKVQYKGDPLVPLISAEDQDRINEDSNKEVAAREKDEALKNRQQILILDQNTQSEAAQGEIRYVPRFIPLE